MRVREVKSKKKPGKEKGKPRDIERGGIDASEKGKGMLIMECRKRGARGSIGGEQGTGRSKRGKNA